MLITSALRYILTIAGIERAMLYRTPKFWVLAGIGVLLVVFFLVATTIASIISDNPPGEFLLAGADAFLALFFFRYVQAILIIFVASDFRKAEEQIHLDQVMLSRPMTTANWVIGKYLGVVGALVYLNLFLLFLAVVGRLFKVIFMGVGFNLLASIEYFAIATLPSILFMTALVFFLVSLLRVQALAIILPLGYVAAILFYFRHQFQGLLDYGCFFAPLFYSDLIGFGDIQTLLWQRLFFVLLALALLSGAIILYPRLRQSVWSQRITQIAALVFFVGAAGVVKQIWSAHNRRLMDRQADLAYQERWIALPTGQVEHYDFDIGFGDATELLQVMVRMAVFNPYSQPLERLVFSLNGAMRVKQVWWAGGHNVDFQQTHQLLEVDLGEQLLQPGGIDTLKLAYSGWIDGDAFMLDRLPEARGVINKTNGPWIKGNLSAWLSPEFAVLPAQFESLLSPLVILGTVPTAVIGSLVALSLSGTPLSLGQGAPMALLGFIVLLGIVVNNGIILLDRIAVLRQQWGYRWQRAVLTAGQNRVRPILMTSVTTMLGVFPLALKQGTELELWPPFAITILGGLAVSTVSTLIFIPVLYVALEQTKAWLQEVGWAGLAGGTLGAAGFLWWYYQTYDRMLYIVLLALPVWFGLLGLVKGVERFLAIRREKARVAETVLHIRIRNLTKIYGAPGRLVRDWQKQRRRLEQWMAAGESPWERSQVREGVIWMMAGGVLLGYLHTFLDHPFWLTVLSLVTLSWLFGLRSLWYRWRFVTGRPPQVKKPGPWQRFFQKKENAGPDRPVTPLQGG